MTESQLERTFQIEVDLQEGELSTVQIAEKHGVATLIVNLILEQMVGGSNAW